MDGMDVVTREDHKLGTVVGERDGCVVVETGHVFKSHHAIPTSFLHEQDGVLRATISKELFEDSPKVDPAELDGRAVRAHYGLDDPNEVTDPDPVLDNAESAGLREGVEPEPSKRLGTLGGENDPSVERPSRLEQRVDPGHGGPSKPEDYFP